MLKACWKHGKELIRFEIPAEVSAIIKKMAKKCGVSYEQFVSIALEDHVIKRRQLEESIERVVRKAFDEEYDRIESALTPLLSPLRGHKGKKLRN